MQTPANRYMLPSKPRNPVINGKYLVTMNEKHHKSVMHNETLKSFTFSGIISDRTMNGMLKIPKAATKMANDKHNTGSQLSESTG